MKIKYLLPILLSWGIPAQAAFNMGEQEPAPIVVGNPEEYKPSKTEIPLDPVLTVDDVPIKQKKKIVIKTEEYQDHTESNQDPIRIGDDPLGKFLEEKGIVTIVPEKSKNKEKTQDKKIRDTDVEEKSPIVVNDAEEQAKLKDLVDNSHVDGIWNIKDNNAIIANQAQNAKPTLQFYSKGDIYGGERKPEDVKKAEQQAMKEMNLTRFFNWGLIGMLVILLLGIIKLILTASGRKAS